MYWNPPKELNKLEEKILKRTAKAKKFYVFLREHRHRIISKDFEDKIINTYRQAGGGKSPAIPGQLTMCLLLQAYCNVSDSEVIELMVMDKRWQMVLNCLNVEEPPFCQATLVNFRERFIENNLDSELLERTAAVAEEYGGFGPRQLKAVLDSTPLFGKGRVEDTFNLLAHAIEKAVRLSAKELKLSQEEIISQIGLQLVGKSSLKAALDLDWSEASAKSEALNRIIEEIELLKKWLKKQKEISSSKPPLKEVMDTIKQIINQDSDPDPDGGGRKIKKDGTKNRRISIEDPEARHGRKSSSKLFNGFKEHLLADSTTRVIKEVIVRPANEAEYLAIDYLPQLEEMEQLSIDLAYAAHPKINQWEQQGVKIIVKPNNVNGTGLFTKADFKLDFKDMTITCPGGYQRTMSLGKTHYFPVSVCKGCSLKEKCTASKNKGRKVDIREDEQIIEQRRLKVKTPEGRAELRMRTVIEHRISHFVAKQGRKAQYIGIRKNQFNGRRYASVLNLQMADYYLDKSKIA